MLSFVRRHLTYANVAATIAVVFAMAGGAVAATDAGSAAKTGAAATPRAHLAKAYKIKSIKEISPSVLKALKGKAGADGKEGAPGKAGANGTNGTNGTAGTAGAAGTNGTNGNSVLHGAGAPASGTGAEGDFYINTASHEVFGPKAGGSWGSGTKLVGPEGPEGPAGSIGKTLPSESTETGVWSFGPLAAEGGAAFINLASFTIPLEAPLDETHVHVLNGTKITHVCEGTVETPTAAPGNLCVYISSLSGGTLISEGVITPELSPGAGVSGALGDLQITAKGPEGFGSWAVTAP